MVQSTWQDRPRRGRGGSTCGAVLLTLASRARCWSGSSSPATRDGHAATAWKASARPLALVVALVLVERSTADPFLAFDLYKNRLFYDRRRDRRLRMICLFAAIMHVPLLVTGVLRHPSQKGGLMLTCMMLPWMVCSAPTKPLLKRFSYRTLAIGGMILAGAAYAMLWQGGHGRSLAPVIVAMVHPRHRPRSHGRPAPHRRPERREQGTAWDRDVATQFTRSMGSAVGLAVLGTLFLAPFGGHEPEGLIDFKVKFDPAQLKSHGRAARRRAPSRLPGDVVFAVLGIAPALSIPAGKLPSSKLRPAVEA